MTTAKRIVLAGGNGLLGTMLAKHLANKGYEIVVFSRTAHANTDNTKFVTWDAKSIGNWQRELDGVFAVINLNGRSVNCRYTEKNRRDILDSRVLSTKAIGEAIARCANP